MTTSQPPKDVAVEAPLVPRESRLQEFWRLLKRNRLALLGLIIFVLFFFTALTGRVLTYGTRP
ncbi:MAG: hypothetical protein HWN71_07950, partial [Desulfobacterales bacterium]|nr:hypothetical protein [Desulfobacterales bacterium]